MVLKLRRFIKLPASIKEAFLLLGLPAFLFLSIFFLYFPIKNFSQEIFYLYQ